MKRILHIISDPKFIDSCKNLFNLNSVENHFLSTKEINDKYLFDNNIDVVVIHYLRPFEADFILKTKSKVKFVWFLWGGDAFNLPSFYLKFFLPKTKNLFGEFQNRQSIPSRLKHLLKLNFPFIFKRSKRTSNFIKAINKIAYIVPIVPGDYKLLKEQYGITSKMYHLNYVNPSNFLTRYPKYSGENILLGNSSTFSNNHLEAIDKLKGIGLGSRKVIIPLNYGDKKYASEIKDYIEKSGLRNQCLLDFLPLNEYKKVISDCEIIIMNHTRQQALGNVIIGLLMGCAIYLNSESTLYKYLIENNFKVFDLNSTTSFSKLSDQEIEDNIKLCSEIFGLELQQSRLSDLLSNLQN